ILVVLRRHEYKQRSRRVGSLRRAWKNSGDQYPVRRGKRYFCMRGRESPSDYQDGIRRGRRYLLRPRLFLDSEGGPSWVLRKRCASENSIGKKDIGGPAKAAEQLIGAVRRCRDWRPPQRRERSPVPSSSNSL